MVRPLGGQAGGGQVGRADGPHLLHAEGLGRLVEGGDHVAEEAQGGLVAEVLGQGVEAEEVDEGDRDVGEGARRVMAALAHLGGARGGQQAFQEPFALLRLGEGLGLLAPEARDHAVEGLPEDPELRVAGRRDLGVGVPAPDAVRGGGEGRDRPGDAARKGDGHQGPEEGEADRRSEGLGGVGAHGREGLLLLHLGDDGPAQGVQVHRTVGGEDLLPTVVLALAHAGLARQGGAGRLSGLGRQQHGRAEALDPVDRVGRQAGAPQPGDEALGVLLQEPGFGAEPAVGADQEDLAGPAKAIVRQGLLDPVRGQAKGHDRDQPVLMEDRGGDEGAGLAEGRPVELEVRHPVIVDILAAPEVADHSGEAAGGVGAGLKAGAQERARLVAVENLQGVGID